MKYFIPAVNTSLKCFLQNSRTKYFVLNIKLVILKRIFRALFHPYSQYWDEIFPPYSCFWDQIFLPKFKIMGNGMNCFVLNIKAVIGKRILWESFHPSSQYWDEIFHPCSWYWFEIFSPKFQIMVNGMNYFVLNIKEIILKRIFWELFHPFSYTGMKYYLGGKKY